MNNQSLWDTHSQPEENNQSSPPLNTGLGRSRPSAFPQTQSSNPVTTGHDHSTNPVATRSRPNSDHNNSVLETYDDRTRPDAQTENNDHAKDATGRDQTAYPDATRHNDQHRPAIPNGEETLTILQATDFLREKGFDDIKPRSVQRYCTGERRRGQLVCYWHEKSQQHLVSLSSLENFAERLADELPPSTSTEEISEPPAPEPSDSETLSDREEPPIPPLEMQPSANFDQVYDHPYVKRLEGQVSEYQSKWEDQVKTTEDIQRQHSKDLASMHQQLMVATSKQYAEAYLELTGTKPPTREPASDFEEVPHNGSPTHNNN